MRIRAPHTPALAGQDAVQAEHVAALDQRSPLVEVAAVRLARDGAAKPLEVALDDGTGERFDDVKFLSRDRRSNFIPFFDAVFQVAGTKIVRTAVQAPRMNAICERLVGTPRRELLDRVLILGEAHLRTMLAEYQAHYNTARPHQGIGQRVPDGEPDGGLLTVTDLDRERIHRTPILGGLVNEHSRAARYPEEPRVPTLILFSSGTGYCP